MPEVENAGATLHYEEHGRGSCVVLAHGAGGNALSWWQQIPVFARRYRTLVIEHRTFGRSRCATDDFRPALFRSDLLAILDHAGVDRAALVCQSMGGWTGLSTAVKSPERVSALVLCGTPGGLRTDAVLENLARIGRRVGGEGIAANAALAPDYPAREPAMTFLYDAIAGLNTGVDPGGLSRLFEAEALIDPAELGGYRVPTLLVAGREDQLFPPEVLREVAGLLPGAELRELEIAGHSTYFELPDTFNEIVGGFLAKHLA